MPRINVSCFIKLPVNCAPRSVKIWRGKPILKFCIVASATALAVITLKGIVSGHRVAIHAAVKINLAPSFTLGKGSTISSPTCLKG